MLTVAWNKTWTSLPFYSGDGLRWRTARKVTAKGGILATEDIIMPREFIEQGGFYNWQGMYYITGQQNSPLDLAAGRPADRAQYGDFPLPRSAALVPH